MFNWFPYTNFHNLNLDWILKKLKDIPTKVSQLENDAGYVTAASAGIITSVNGQTGDVVLDAADVGALPDSTVIPTNTSDLVNDSGFISSILDAYPVGSIYISTQATNPGSLFGGTWQQIEDVFLLTAGSTYTAGDTGGSATHTLTTAEMPVHNHSDLYVGSVQMGWKSGIVTTGTGSGLSVYTTGSTSISTSAAGSGNAHNNMPPYLVVYAFERTA